MAADLASLRHKYDPRRAPHARPRRRRSAPSRCRGRSSSSRGGPLRGREERDLGRDQEGGPRLLGPHRRHLGGGGSGRGAGGTGGCRLRAHEELHRPEGRHAVEDRKQFYGEANEYKQIFEANSDQLKDPDKIQPGQVLRIPS